VLNNQKAISEKDLLMNARSYALIATFAALAVVLNTIRIPTVYWPGMFYTLCDIPVVVAFLIYGFKIGILVEVLHILGQEIFFPAGPAGIVVYPMGLIYHTLMFSGIYLAGKFINRRAASPGQFGEKKRAVYFTFFAAAFRGGLMPVIDSAVLYNILLPLVLGVAIPEAYIFALVPSFVLYNVTTTLYLVPVAYLLARRVSNYLGLKPQLPIQI
jgi:riboflavin transporter FmnP